MILFIILLTALVNITLGVVVYNKNPKSDTHRLLAFLTVIFAAWTIANYFSLNSTTEDETLFWIRTVMFVTVPLGPVLYFFIKAFPNTKLEVNKNIIRFSIFLILLVQGLSYTPYIFSSVTIADQITPKPEWGIILFAILFVGLPIAGCVNLVRKYSKSAGVEKLQFKYLIAGIVMTFTLLIVTNFIAVVMFNYSKLVIFGPIFSLILVAFISYSIIKHRLLEVKVIIVRSVIFTLSILVITALYIMAVFIASLYIFEIQLDLIRAGFYAALALFASFTLVPLKAYFERASDKIFFKSKYNSTELTNKLIKNVASTFDIKVLTSKTLSTLSDAMKISHSAFVVYSGKKVFLYARNGYTLNQDMKKALIKLSHNKKMIILDEAKNQKLKSIMRILDIAIYLPLYERHQKIGALLLGVKKTGQIYSSIDVSVLEIFGPVIAVAIRNAFSYEKISKFNITLKKEVQKAVRNLRKANDQLRKLDKQKDEFMAIASHELKTPVTSIKLYSQLLRNKLSNVNNKHAKNSLDKIEGQINKLVRLINDLLDVARIEEGKMKFNIVSFDPNKMIGDVIQEMSLITKQKFVLELGTLVPIEGDEERISQILVNFIANAGKYSPKNKKIIVGSKKEKNNIVIYVRDFGPGLRLEEQKLVFERFNRAGQEYSGGMPGLGLGLYISKEIVARHNGKIWVESIQNEGSTFFFSLPLSR